MSHGDKITEIPAGFKVTATNDNCPVAAFANTAENFYGVQFHPEVQHSVHGNEMLKNFAFRSLRLAQATGQSPTSSKSKPKKSEKLSATKKSCWDCPAGLIQA